MWEVFLPQCDINHTPWNVLEDVEFGGNINSVKCENDFELATETSYGYK